MKSNNWKKAFEEIKSPMTMEVSWETYQNLIDASLIERNKMLVNLQTNYFKPKKKK